MTDTPTAPPAPVADLDDQLAREILRQRADLARVFSMAGLRDRLADFVGSLDAEARQRWMED